MIKALEKAGLYIVRQTGSYVILEQSEGSQGGAEMHKQGLLRPVPVPKHASDLKRKLLYKIIKEAGLTPEEFAKLL